MLNRRYLRIKVMQTLFANWQCRRSNYHLALDHIKDTFQPDLNSMEPQDPVELKENQQAASELFDKSYQQGTLAPAASYESVQKSAAVGALNLYQQWVARDKQRLRKIMLEEAQSLHLRYLDFLLLLLALRKEAEQHAARASRTTHLPDPNWQQNRVFKLIEENKALQTEAIRHGLGWDSEEDFTRQLYREILLQNESFQEYLGQESTTFEQDKQMVLHVIKKIFFKHEEVASFMENRDLHWAENREILRSMVQRTAKDLEEGSPAEFELAVLSFNWEDDKEFFLDLFDKTLLHEEEYNQLIASRSRNWDVERMALLDRIILSMALTEMINFPSIPVKVTINEYIELSKKYSTPKSKTFVNGVLDVLSNELLKSGQIRKSGRGLIDQ